ncbi:MAG: nucleotidyl transferase AbiEii/AbiGii toxin family protein [Actinomycetota bacterium]|nr:nucleotidyl transferase AbiEii/AbiGii toxin family protein [Rubrobacteraceae bacterium]MDQ3498613.1 nucleotidyl transferase AbiEii/AbiGii toxin family protein [Actinomycetota bacterium]
MRDPQTPQQVYRALQRRARDEGRGTQELFEFYLLERFLYRLAISQYRDRFVLKGGLLLKVLGVRRPTRDADVLARKVASDEESLLAVVKEVANIAVDDGMTFDASRALAMTIREHAAYPGTRIVVPATLGTARLQLRLDVNFGDPAGAQQIHYPTLLSDELIDLLGYPVETVIAEKVETMISRGDANTRERDYADVLALSRIHPVGARRLRYALERTAAHRGTDLMPLAHALDTLPTARQRDWRAFLDRSGLPDVPESFEEAVEEVRAFVDPVLRNDSDLLQWNPVTRAWKR